MGLFFFSFSKACNCLGVSPQAVTAELHKLELDRTVNWDVFHNRTEKADGMFATLIIVLLSIYKVQPTQCFLQ